LSTKLFKRDVLGNLILFKRVLFIVFGAVANTRFKSLFNTKLHGTEIIRQLPMKNVLFVSNHQTYFADVTMMLIAISSAKNGFKDKLGPLYHLLNANFRVYFVAAKETMKKSALTKVMTQAGGILVQRTWKKEGTATNLKVDTKDSDTIGDALTDGWVITFPQGTTTPFVRGRKGTAHIIKKHKPIVIPVVIDGFRRSFDKKGLLIKKKGSTISMTFKPALNINYDDDLDSILNQVMYSIEQSEEFYPEKLKRKLNCKTEQKKPQV
jgi:1-acyl-sn-glycerol-3-phosphate acyltransferase